jgi:magnesium transporter
MQLMPLHKISAPSPSVLSFLRTQVQHAFDSPIAHRAALKSQRCGYVTASRAARGSRLGVEGGKVTVTSLESGAFRNCKPERKSYHSSRIRLGQLDHATSRTQLTAQSTSTRPPLKYIRTNRAFTTTSSSRAWQLFGGKRRQDARIQPPPPLKDVIDTPVGFDSLGRMTRAANELKMRCTELDEQGNVTMVSGEFKKSELIAKVCSCILPISTKMEY